MMRDDETRELRGRRAACVCVCSWGVSWARGVGANAARTTLDGYQIHCIRARAYALSMREARKVCAHMHAHDEGMRDEGVRVAGDHVDLDRSIKRDLSVSMPRSGGAEVPWSRRRWGSIGSRSNSEPHNTDQNVSSAGPARAVPFCLLAAPIRPGWRFTRVHCTAPSAPSLLERERLCSLPTQAAGTHAKSQLAARSTPAPATPVTRAPARS
jgi:hypothetical protein